jgi:DNA-binding CsgD family transcriptional regulator
MGDYDQLVRDIYDAGLDAGGWSRVSAGVCSLVGGDIFFVYLCEPDGRPTRTLAAHVIEPPAIGHYMDYYWQGNPMVPRMLAAPLDTVCRFTDVCGPIFEHSEVFRDWAVPNGLVENVGWRGLGGGRDILAAAVSRTSRSPFKGNALTWLARVAPHMTQAARLHHSIARAHATAHQLRQLVGGTQLATFLLDGDASVIEANAAARAMLQTADVLDYSDGRLRAVDSTSDQRLASAIDEWTRGGAAMPVRLAPSSSGATAYIVSHDDALDRRAATTCLLIVVQPPAEAASTTQAGLSPRMSQVLDLLLFGSSDKEIAEALAISHASARTYVTRLFRQLEVRSRGELWRRYRGSPAATRKARS